MNMLFSLAKPATVNVSVFNLFGQKVKQLANSFFPQGQSELLWDGVDAQGNPVASGAYFLALEVDGRMEKRMVLFQR